MTTRTIRKTPRNIPLNRILTPDHLTLVSREVHRTWQVIGYDVLSACAEAGERCTNEAAVEACIDADRLWANAQTKADEARGREAQEALRAAFKVHGYDIVLRALARDIHLN